MVRSPSVRGLVAALVAVVGTAACEGPADRTAREGEVAATDGGTAAPGRGTAPPSAPEDTVIALYAFDERALGPYWGMEARYLVFLPMVTREGDEWGGYRPGLAERWEHSPDYREWTFHLRPELRWHDGAPVTAEDVAFTVRLRNHPDVAGAGAAARERVEVVDAHTIRFVYPEPTRGPDWWSVYYPKHLLEDRDPAGFYGWDFWVQPVGNGPFRYVRHVPKTMTELEANPDYPGGPPAVDRVILRYASIRTWPAELQAGNAHTASYVDRLTALKISEDPRFRRTEWWGSYAQALFWNHRRPLFSDARVRRALSRAVDRRELANVLDYPEEVPLHADPCLEDARRGGTCPRAPPPDRERAGRLLEAAGWSDRDGDGIREGPSSTGEDAGAPEARFTLMTTEEGRRIAVYLQDQLRRVGVAMEIAVLDGSLAHDRSRSGDYDAFLHLFRHPTKLYDSQLDRWVGPEGRLGWRHRRAEELARRAPTTVAPADRRALYAELREIFREEEPLTLLVPQVQTHVAHRSVCGLRSPERAEPVWFMEFLWMDPSGECAGGGAGSR